MTDGGLTSEAGASLVAPYLVGILVDRFRLGWRDPIEAKSLLNLGLTGAEICASSAGQQRLMELFL